MKQALKSLIQFCKVNAFDKALVTTLDQQGIKNLETLKFTFLPAAVYTYNIGDITLKMKNTN